MKNKWFIDDHETFCKAQFKWANDDHEAYHKAYRLQNCQRIVSTIATPRPDEISDESGQNEKNWKSMAKKKFQELDLDELNKLGTLFDCKLKNDINKEKLRNIEKNKVGCISNFFVDIFGIVDPRRVVL